jgi:hypothetical protein
MGFEAARDFLAVIDSRLSSALVAMVLPVAT